MDNSNQVPPQEPINNLPPPQNPIVQPQPTSVSPIPPINSKKRIVIIGVIIVLLIVGSAVAWFVFSKKDKQSSTSQQTENSSQTIEPKTIEQVFISPIDGSRTEIEKNVFYRFKSHEIIYYGQINKVSDDYMQVVPTAFEKSGTLELTVKDFHGPEFATYFHVSEVVSIQKVFNSSELVNKPEVNNETLNKIIKLLSDNHYSSQNVEVSTAITGYINTYLQSSRYKAFSLRDGAMVYANVSSLEGNFLANAKHVYILKGDQANPTLFADKPENYKNRNASEIVYWQNLNPSSKVAQAAETYEKANN